MFAKYGSFQHDANEADVTYSIRTSYSPRGNRDIETRSVSFTGVLIPSSASQANIDADAVALEAAYATGGKDFGFFTDASALTHISLPNSGAIGGVRVLSVAWPEGNGAEFATGRTYQITLEAQYLATAGLLAFSESTSTTGDGGPVVQHFPLLNGSPEEQQIWPSSTIKATQNGDASSSLGYPAAPGRLFSNEHRDRRRVSRSASEDRGRTIFRTSWSYSFESPSLRLVSPNTG